MADAGATMPTPTGPVIDVTPEPTQEEIYGPAALWQAPPGSDVGQVTTVTPWWFYALILFCIYALWDEE